MTESYTDLCCQVVLILLESNPKDKSWGAAQKMMNNVDKFLERLKGFKALVDAGQARLLIFAELLCLG